MHIVAFNQEAYRLRRLAEGMLGTLRTAHLLTAREARPFEALNAGIHAVPTINACLEGVIRVRWSGGHLDLTPGEAIVVAPGAWHEHAALRSGSAWYGQGLIRDCSDIFLASPEQALIAGIPRSLVEDRLHRVVLDTDPASRLALVREILGISLAAPATGLEWPAQLAAMTLCIDRRLHLPLRADEVLAASGMTPRHARRLFITGWGEGPKGIILKLKLMLARHLLAEGWSQVRAARDCGFIDVANFRRAWRRAHGEALSSESRDPADETEHS